MINELQQVNCIGIVTDSHQRTYQIPFSSTLMKYVQILYLLIYQILVYNGYNKDFGPLSLAQVHRFCTELKRIMKDDKYRDVKIFHHCSPHFQKQSNACYLMGAFMMVCYGYTAEEAWHPFKHL